MQTPNGRSALHHLISAKASLPMAPVAQHSALRADWPVSLGTEGSQAADLSQIT